MKQLALILILLVGSSALAQIGTLKNLKNKGSNSKDEKKKKEILDTYGIDQNYFEQEAFYLATLSPREGDQLTALPYGVNYFQGYLRRISSDLEKNKKIASNISISDQSSDLFSVYSDEIKRCKTNISRFNEYYNQFLKSEIDSYLNTIDRVESDHYDKIKSLAHILKSEEQKVDLVALVDNSVTANFQAMSSSFGSTIAAENRGSAEIIGYESGNIADGSEFSFNCFFEDVLDMDSSISVQVQFYINEKQVAIFDSEIGKTGPGNNQAVFSVIGEKLANTEMRVLDILQKLTQGKHQLRFDLSTKKGNNKCSGGATLNLEGQAVLFQAKHKQLQQEKISSRKIPEAHMKDETLEAKMIKSINSTDYFVERSQQAFDVVIIDENWIEKRDIYNQITSHYLKTYIITKNEQSQCFLWDVDFKEAYINEAYGPVQWKRIGSSKEINCSN